MRNAALTILLSLMVLVGLAPRAYSTDDTLTSEQYAGQLRAAGMGADPAAAPPVSNNGPDGQVPTCPKGDGSCNFGVMNPANSYEPLQPPPESTQLPKGSASAPTTTESKGVKH